MKPVRPFLYNFQPTLTVFMTTTPTTGSNQSYHTMDHTATRNSNDNESSPSATRLSRSLSSALADQLRAALQGDLRSMQVPGIPGGHRLPTSVNPSAEQSAIDSGISLHTRVEITPPITDTPTTVSPGRNHLGLPGHHIIQGGSAPKRIEGTQDSTRLQTSEIPDEIIVRRFARHLSMDEVPHTDEVRTRSKSF